MGHLSWPRLLDMIRKIHFVNYSSKDVRVLTLIPFKCSFWNRSAWPPWRFSPVAIAIIYCVLFRGADRKLGVGVSACRGQREERDPSVSVGAAAGTQKKQSCQRRCWLLGSVSTQRPNKQQSARPQPLCDKTHMHTARAKPGERSPNSSFPNHRAQSARRAPVCAHTLQHTCTHANAYTRHSQVQKQISRGSLSN